MTLTLTLGVIIQLRRYLGAQQTVRVVTNVGAEGVVELLAADAQQPRRLARQQRQLLVRCAAPAAQLLLPSPGGRSASCCHSSKSLIMLWRVNNNGPGCKATKRRLRGSKAFS